MTMLETKPNFVASLEEDQTFDLLIVWLSQGPLMIVGNKGKVGNGFATIETFLGEKVAVPISDKVIVMGEVDKGRFAQLKEHLRGIEIGGELPEHFYQEPLMKG